MYKLLIADDNSIIRNGLIKFIDWHELGFRISGEAGNGAEALEMIRNDPPDAILLDIRMPVMSGLELMDCMGKEKPNINIIILSAYNEFTYVKKALEVGAKDFILKPFNKDKIKEIFGKIKLDLDHKKREQQYSSEWARMKRDKLFYNTLKKGDLSSLPPLLEQFGLRSDCSQYAIISLYPDPFTFTFESDEYGVSYLEADTRKASLYSLLADTFPERDNCRIFLRELEQATIILGYEYNSDEIVIRGRQLIAAINEQLGCDLKVFYKADIPRLSDIMLHYQHIQELNKHRLYFKNNHMNDAVPPELHKSELSPASLIDISAKTAAYATNGEYDRILEYIESVFTLVKTKEMLLNEELYTIYLGFIAGMQTHHGTIRSEQLKGIQKATYSEFLTFHTIEDIVENLYSSLSLLYESAEPFKESRNSKLIEAVKAYVSEHYAEEVTLNDVARHVFLHPIYFCSLFKKETGQTFNHFLTRIRLDHALQLMKQTNMKIYEISDAVGYKSTKHFSRLFKDYVGVLPKEYKNRTLLK